MWIQTLTRILRAFQPRAIGGHSTPRPTGSPTPGPSEPSLAILLVDHEPIFQIVVSRSLERRGLTVTVCEDGAEALKRVAAQKFDVVVVNIEMPNLDGVELTEIIRRQETGTSRRTPIIGVTRAAAPEEREECLASGMDACLAKPVSMDDLVKTIRTVTTTPARSSVSPEAL